MLRVMVSAREPWSSWVATAIMFRQNEMKQHPIPLVLQRGRSGLLAPAGVSRLDAVTVGVFGNDYFPTTTRPCRAPILRRLSLSQRPYTHTTLEARSCCKHTSLFLHHYVSDIDLSSAKSSTAKYRS
jgi:hypothetical protein